MKKRTLYTNCDMVVYDAKPAVATAGVTDVDRSGAATKIGGYGASYLLAELTGWKTGTTTAT